LGCGVLAGAGFLLEIGGKTTLRDEG